MGGIAQPRFGIFSKYGIGDKDWGDEVNTNFCRIDQLMHICVDGIGPLPVSGTPGQQWIDPAGNLNTWITGWEALPPRCGMTAWENNGRCMYVYDGSTWVDLTVIIQNKLAISGQAVADAIATDPAMFYGFNVGGTPPTGAPQSPFFPFHVNTSMTPNIISAYDYTTGSWTMLNEPSAVLSGGAPQSGFLPRAGGDGKIDESWLDLTAIAGAIGSVAGGSLAQSGVPPLGDPNGKINNTWLNLANNGGVAASANMLVQSDATGFIDDSFIDHVTVSTGAADAEKFADLDATGRFDCSVIPSEGFIWTDDSGLAFDGVFEPFIPVQMNAYGNGTVTGGVYTAAKAGIYVYSATMLTVFSTTRAVGAPFEHGVRVNGVDVVGTNRVFHWVPAVNQRQSLVVSTYVILAAGDTVNLLLAEGDANGPTVLEPQRRVNRGLMYLVREL